MGYDFRRKPSIVQAIRWTGENFDIIDRMTNSHIARLIPRPSLRGTHVALDFYRHLQIRKIGGSVEVGVGDWIIKDELGDIYSCDDDAFNIMYERVEN